MLFIAREGIATYTRLPHSQKNKFPTFNVKALYRNIVQSHFSLQNTNFQESMVHIKMTIMLMSFWLQIAMH